MDNADIKFKYLFSDDYDPTYVNGVYGGVNPSGELIMNFFMERIPLPYEEAVGITEEGFVDGSEVVSPDEYKYIRSIKTGVIMNRETAQTIIEWMQAVLSETEMDNND